MLTCCRRRSERVLTSWKAWIRHPYGVVDATVTDVNATGLFVRTVRPGDLGRIVTVRVQLSDGPMDLYGLVRFIGMTVAGRGMGVELLVMAANKRQRWLRHYQTLVSANPEWLAA